MEKNPRLIQSLKRAFLILDCFDDLNPRLQLNEIAQKVNLNINTTRGLVNTLLYFNYLGHDEMENSYYLGYAFIPKAQHVEEHTLNLVRTTIKPFLAELANKYNMSARLQRVASGQLVTVYTEVPMNSRYLLMTRSTLPFPLHATSSGKVYLTYVDPKLQEEYLREASFTKFTDKTIQTEDKLREEIKKIKERGYALELDEINEGIGSIAFPLFSRQNKCYGTISLSSSTEEILDKEENIAKEVQSFIAGLKLSDD